MIIIGADYHPGFQQVAYVDTDTGDLQERRLEHREDAEKFYRDLAAQEVKVRVGMEASGHARWFERLLAELQFELWIPPSASLLSLSPFRLVSSRCRSSEERNKPQTAEMEKQ